MAKLAHCEDEHIKIQIVKGNKDVYQSHMLMHAFTILIIISIWGPLLRSIAFLCSGCVYKNEVIMLQKFNNADASSKISYTIKLINASGINNFAFVAVL